MNQIQEAERSYRTTLAKTLSSAMGLKSFATRHGSFNHKIAEVIYSNFVNSTFTVRDIRQQLHEGNSFRVSQRLWRLANNGCLSRVGSDRRQGMPNVYKLAKNISASDIKSINDKLVKVIDDHVNLINDINQRPKKPKNPKLIPLYNALVLLPDYNNLPDLAQTKITRKQFVRLKRIVRMRLEGMSLRSIGSKILISGERVRQLEERIHKVVSSLSPNGEIR